MRSQFLWTLAIAALVFPAVAIGNARAASASITFDNQSGDPALVKLLGPATRLADVPNGQRRTVYVAPGGQYFIKTRYGADAQHYRYVHGDPFAVMVTTRQYSVITITLHSVPNGNYPTHPDTAEDFNRSQ